MWSPLICWRVVLCCNTCFYVVWHSRDYPHTVEFHLLVGTKHLYPIFEYFHCRRFTFLQLSCLQNSPYVFNRAQIRWLRRPILNLYILWPEVLLDLSGCHITKCECGKSRKGGNGLKWYSRDVYPLGCMWWCIVVLKYHCFTDLSALQFGGHPTIQTIDVGVSIN